MKKILIIFLLLIFTKSGNGQKVASPQKIDEFGDLNSESLTSRIENFSIELGNSPTAKGYRIIFRHKNLPPDYPVRLGMRINL